MIQWGQVTTDYMNPGISNHYPMMITFQYPQPSGKISFKIFNVWIEHGSFLSLVETEWKKPHKQRKIKEVRMKLKYLRSILIYVNNTEFKYINQKIEKAQK